MPAIALSERLMSDLYLVAVGGLSPLTGFMGSDDYESVLADMRLASGLPWAVPIVLPASDQEIESLADDVIWVPSLDPFLQPMVANVPLQLLAYYIADHRGTDVDQPRNLAKSVTVE